MKIVTINGQNHKGSTYTIGRMLAEKLADGEEIVEFFLPEDLDGFCRGCYACVKDEKICPFYEKKKPIAEAMEQSEVLIFTTPNYCMDMSAPLKSFVDLFFQYWIPHRPREYMFSKKAVVISTAAGVGMGHAIKPVKRTLKYWGVPYVKGYGVAVAACNWKGVPEKKKQAIVSHVAALARKVKRARVGKPGLYIRLLFNAMAAFKKRSAPDAYDSQEALYWKENGWLDGDKPWKKKKQV